MQGTSNGGGIARQGRVGERSVEPPLKVVSKAGFHPDPFGAASRVADVESMWTLDVDPEVTG